VSRHEIITSQKTSLVTGGLSSFKFVAIRNFTNALSLCRSKNSITLATSSGAICHVIFIGRIYCGV
jgi:hypothetical protein